MEGELRDALESRVEIRDEQVRTVSIATVFALDFYSAQTAYVRENDVFWPCSLVMSKFVIFGQPGYQCGQVDNQIKLLWAFHKNDKK